jgi:hypothetical protein
MQSVMPPNLKDENENGCRQRGRRKAAAKRTANAPSDREAKDFFSQRVSERNHKGAAEKLQSGSRLPLRSTIRTTWTSARKTRTKTVYSHAQ